MRLMDLMPLILASALYAWMAYNYAAALGRPGLMLAFAGYAVANVGFIWDAWR